MGKRAINQTAAKSAAKKVKADPVYDSIAEVITEAEDIPDRCRAMLIDVFPLSLLVSPDERHEVHTAVIDMVKQIFNSKASLMGIAAASEDQKLTNLQASQGEITNKVKDAEAALARQKDVVEAATCLLADATAAAKACLNTFSERQAEQKTSAAKLAQAQAEKDSLSVALEMHFKSLKEGAEGPHFESLEPHLEKLDIEASLLIALPSICAKPKAQRGSFDLVVLEELEKALSSKIAALAAAVTVDTLASVEHEAAAKAAQEEYDVKKDTQKHSAAEFEAAQKVQSDREEALKNARQALEELQTQIAAATEQMERAKTALGAFRAGPMATFESYSSVGSETAMAMTAGA